MKRTRMGKRSKRRSQWSVWSFLVPDCMRRLSGQEMRLHKRVLLTSWSSWSTDLDSRSLSIALTNGIMPNLAAFLESQRLTAFSSSFVSYSLCCPSRATFLTGQYAHNHGVKGNDHIAGNNPQESGCEPLNESSNLATWLDGSYRTGIIGKYLNDVWLRLPVPRRPHALTFSPCAARLERMGSAEWRLGSGSPAHQLGNAQRMYHYDITNHNGDIDYNILNYQTNELKDRAVTFINNPSTTPFFLYVTPTAPHREAGVASVCSDNLPFGPTTTIQPYPDFDALAAGVALPGVPSFNEADVSDKPAHVAGISAMSSPISIARTALIRIDWNRLSRWIRCSVLSPWLCTQRNQVARF